MDNITDFIFYLSLLFIPGIVGSLILRYLTVHREFSQFYFIVYSLILGVLSYSILELVTKVYMERQCDCYDFYYCFIVQDFGKNLDFWNLIKSDKRNFNLIELIQASLIGFTIAIFISWIFNKKFIPKIANYMDITHRSGDDDSWNYFLNSNEVFWIFVRDQDLGITYFGNIKHFSEPGLPRELVLEEVDVFKTKNGKKLYELRRVYLDLSKGKFTIEFPNEEGE